MNTKERKELGYFPAGLDAAVNKKFGAKVECETSYSIIDMRHITNFKTKDPVLKDKINLYIEAFLAGTMELRERLEHANDKPQPELELEGFPRK